MKKDLAVVLVSGGLDSCVAAAIARQNYRLAFLHIKYKQKTEKREFKAFNDICNFYSIKKRLICNFTHLKDIGGSSLTDKSSFSTYVPFRNAQMLSCAVSWAETIGAKKIFIGTAKSDASLYPDCREEFYDIFNTLIKKGAKKRNIKIITPLIKLKKSETIKKGLKLFNNRLQVAFV